MDVTGLLIYFDVAFLVLRWSVLQGGGEPAIRGHWERKSACSNDQISGRLPIDSDPEFKKTLTVALYGAVILIIIVVSLRSGHS